MIEKLDKAIGSLLNSIIDGRYEAVDIDNLLKLVNARVALSSCPIAHSPEPKVYGPLPGTLGGEPK